MKVHAYKPNLIEHRGEIVKMDMDGIPLTKIAQKYDVSHQAISQFLKRHRAGSVSKTIRTTQKKLKLNDFLTKHDLPTLAKTENISLAGLYTFCKRNSVKYKKNLPLSHPDVKTCKNGHDVTNKEKSVYSNTNQCKACKALAQKKLKSKK